MGVEDPDWVHPSAPGAGGSVARATGSGAAAVLVVLLVVAFVGWRFGLARIVPGYNQGAQVEASLSPGAPAAQNAPLYPPGDAWSAWLAPEDVCPGGERLDAAPEAELSTMLCLINYARQRQGLIPVALTSTLDTASFAKAEDIVRCGRFEHAACGKAPSQVAVDAGYVGSFGENLYAAEGALGSPRVALDAWLNSPHHRENLFRPQWRTAGLAALHGATFDRFHGAVVWVSQFGDH